MIMSPAQHFAAASGLLATADAHEHADDPEVLYLVRSAHVHALLATADLQVYSDAKDYTTRPGAVRPRHIVAGDDGYETEMG